MAEAYSAEPIVVAAARTKVLAKLTAAGAPYSTVPFVASPVDRSKVGVPFIACYDGNQEDDWRAQRTEGSIVYFEIQVYTYSADQTRAIVSLIRRALGERPQFWVLPSGFKLITLRPETVRQSEYLDNTEHIYGTVLRYRASVSITKT